MHAGLDTLGLRDDQHYGEKNMTFGVAHKRHNVRSRVDMFYYDCLTAVSYIWNCNIVECLKGPIFLIINNHL